MPLSAGTRLGHYDVTALIGEGGMGQVWQATDTQLNRQVALKILPDAFAADPDRLARFQREAQVLASLNHPNIAQIHGIEEAEGTRALVLELVEGPTLADRISKGPIPLDEALPIAKQIAEALEAAHEAGVIHRDLKPANIKVREDGTVKVLDFGLAKALEPAPDADPSQSPTLTAAATQMGVIMGTAACMSPEQARGKTVDKRADIWAFGCVLYEMLTGRRAFEGEDVSEVLATVIKDDPDWALLSTHVPVVIRRVVRRCLDKDPRERLRDIADAAYELRQVGVGEAPEEAAFERSRPARSVLLRYAAVAIVSGAVGALALLTVGSEQAPRSGVTRLEAEVPATHWRGISAQPLALSRDGRLLIYAGAGAEGDMLHLRRLDTLQVEVIPGTIGAQSPFLSPDGEWVAFFARGRLVKVALDSGLSVDLAAWPGFPGGGSWTDRNTIIIAANLSISEVSADGGEPRALPVSGLFPHALPGGSGLLITVLGSDGLAVVAVVEGGAETPRMLLPGSDARYLSTGHLVFLRDEGLWGVAFDLDRLAVTGEPQPLVDGVEVGSSVGSFGLFGVSDEGTLAYLPRGHEDRRTLVWVDHAGHEAQLGVAPFTYDQPAISPDGRRIAVLATGDDGNEDIYIYDRTQDNLVRFTFDPAIDRAPVWSPDGTRLFFLSARAPSTRADVSVDVFAKSADGTGPVERLTDSLFVEVPYAISPDGSTLLTVATPDDGDFDIRALDLGGDADTRPLVSSEFPDNDPAVSPDGRWLAYVRDAGGTAEVAIRPYPNVDDGYFQVSQGGGMQPKWSADGDRLFFLSGNTMMAVDVGSGTPAAWSRPRELFSGSYFNNGLGAEYDVDPNGDRFLMIKRVGDLATRFVVALNWVDQLTERVPVP